MAPQQFEYYQVNSFTRQFNGGNPAGVVPIAESTFPGDSVLQAIATENNFSETAYYLHRNQSRDTSNADAYQFDLRWFTPGAEVDLCGHATLASAHILVQVKGFKYHPLHFHTHSGVLKVVYNNDSDRYDMSLPAPVTVPATLPEAIMRALPSPVLDVQLCQGGDHIVLLQDETTLRNYKPDFSIINKVDSRGIVCTAPGDKDISGVDFVSRFFVAEAYGIDEDPVTGSAHAELTPYWCKRLGRDGGTSLTAMQVSARVGHLWCTLEQDGKRVTVSGHGVTYCVGTLFVDIDSNQAK